MADNDFTLNLSLNFGKAKFSANDAEKPISMAIQNVAFKSARNRQRNLKANIHRDFAPVVERQLQKMAADVARLGVGMGNTRNPPSGALSITGKVSKYTLDSSPMSISSMTGTWAIRTKAYMKAKFKRYRTRKWFKSTGRLQDQLGKVGTYRSAYGPMSIKFIPQSLSGKGRVSNLGKSPGGQSENIIIGRLEVSPLRRLRLSDLPALGQQAAYKKSLLSPLADSVERKLTGDKNKYRPVIEPFLTYYMTRKIPNAVFLKLEQSLG